MYKNRSEILCLALIVLLGSVNALDVRSEEAKPITCTGKVIDEQGRPIANVEVGQYERIFGQMGQSYDTRLVAKVLTKADGQFTFSIGMKSDSFYVRYLVAEKEGFALGWANWYIRDGAAQGLEIKLSEKAKLEGIVVDENDRPIPQAKVSIYWLAFGEEEDQQYLLYDIVPELLTTQTDNAGRFTFTNLPADAKAEFLVRKTGYATVCTYTSSRDLKYTTGQIDIRLLLLREASIQGVVVERDSAKPIPDVKLEVRREGNRSVIGQDPVSTTEDGTFNFNALTGGKYVIQLVRSRDGFDEWVAEPVKVELGAGQVQKDTQIEICKGGLLEILITDAQTNQPLEKAHVSIRDEMRSQWIYGISDNKGIVHIPMLPGSYRFNTVSLQGYSSKNLRNSFTIEDGITKHFEEQLTSQPKFTGIVRDEKGKPVKGAKIIICPIGIEEVSSDVEGRFEISWDPGMASDERQAPHLVCRHMEDNLASVVILSEGVRTHDVTLKPGVRVTGKVVDPNGRGLSDVLIRIMLRQTMWASTITRDPIRTDTEGNFEITALPVEQRYNLKISSNGYGDNQVDIHADDAVNNSIEIGEVKLPVANLAVSGLVTNPQGNPIANARIESYNFESGQPEHLTTQTDSSGHFTLDGVCEGKLNIHVNVDREGKRLSARAITNGGATGIKIIAREGHPVLQNLKMVAYNQIIRESEKVIAGVALDESGTPIAGVPVGVCCHKRKRENGKFTWTFSDFSDLTATTDKQGRFAIELKEDGEYNLRFSPDHHAAMIVYDVPVGKKDLKVILLEGGTVTGRLVQMDKGRKVPIPNVEVKIEQPDRASYTHLGFDRDQTIVTDAEGRFRFEHLQTKIRPHGSMSRQQWNYIARVWEISYGDTSMTVAFYDDTRIVDLELLVTPKLTEAQTLMGQTLPGFDGITIDLNADQTENKMMLICFFDMNQRPSRHCTAQLAERIEHLKEKGVAIIAIQASKVEENELQEWITQSNIPFPVGRVQGHDENIRFTWGIKLLPWLVLADKDHIVLVEGFALGELDSKIAQNSAAN